MVVEYLMNARYVTNGPGVYNSKRGVAYGVCSVPFMGLYLEFSTVCQQNNNNSKESGSGTFMNTIGLLFAVHTNSQDKLYTHSGNELISTQ